MFYESSLNPLHQNSLHTYQTGLWQILKPPFNVKFKVFCISCVLQQLADQFHLVASQKHDPCLPPVFVPRGNVDNCDDDDDGDHEEGDNDDDDCICGNDDNFHQKFSSLNPSRINIKRVDISLKQQIVEVIKLVGGWFAWGSALSSPGWRSPVSGRVNHISGPVAPIYTTATTPPYICNSRAQVPNRPKTTKKVSLSRHDQCNHTSPHICHRWFDFILL